MKKYELIPSFDLEGLGNHYRVKSLKKFSDVNVGDLGGYVENEFSLSQDGDCWVYDNSYIVGGSRVIGNAKIRPGVTLSQGSIAKNNVELSRLNNSGRLVFIASIICDDVYIKANVSKIINSKLYGNTKIIGENIDIRHCTTFDNSVLKCNEFSNMSIVNSTVFNNSNISGCVKITDSKIFGSCKIENKSNNFTEIINSQLYDNCEVIGEVKIINSQVFGDSLLNGNVKIENSKLSGAYSKDNFTYFNNCLVNGKYINVNGGGSVTFESNDGDVNITL